MSEQSRALPDRPNLRFLKIEAKRRLAAAEFTSLHDAQLAIAREHGFSSWTTLKESVAENAEPTPALTHVQWLIDRFRGADDPAWTAPEDAEIRAHFTERYLTLMPLSTIVDTLRNAAARLAGDLVVASSAESALRAQLGDLRVEAMTHPEPPHLLTSLRMYPVGRGVHDPRVTDPPASAGGPVPADVDWLADESFRELGLAGLAMAGRIGESPLWTVTRGWTDLDRHDPLGPATRFPCYGIAKLVTSTTVLILVAQGLLDLDSPANTYLRSIRLADDGVTVRELLTHTGGVASPDAQFAQSVPDQAELLGRTVSCDNQRGTFAASNGGYAVLGQLIADVTGAGFADTATRLVLTPLGMSDSSFPATWQRGLTGYHLAENGVFEAAPAQVSTMPAAGGLWATVADIVRFGVGWTTLLPAELVAEALRPSVDLRVPVPKMGLGWLVNADKGVHGQSGAGPGAATSLIIRPATHSVTVVGTNRLVPIEQVNVRLSKPAGPAD